jgi:hypothetical protein
VGKIRPLVYGLLLVGLLAWGFADKGKAELMKGRGFISNAGLVGWSDDLQRAKKAAAKSGKPLFIGFTDSSASGREYDLSTFQTCISLWA